MTTVEVFAPAKINLALHVTGRRKDGYHELDTLVAFADIGDRLTLTRVPDTGGSDRSHDLRVSGPESGGVPTDDSNLVVRAASLLGLSTDIAITLDKHIPAASGVGGGSADAAAVVRAGKYGWDLPTPALEVLARRLGADVPMCLAPHPLRATGVGERLAGVELPSLHCVLVNPRVPISTGSVFDALKDNTATGLGDLPRFRSARELCGWLREMRNDLEEPAIGIEPSISEVLDALSIQPGLLLARMSGSGATCFGVFIDRGLAEIAAQNISRGAPDWWVRDCVLGNMSDIAAPNPG